MEKVKQKAKFLFPTLLLAPYTPISLCITTLQHPITTINTHITTMFFIYSSTLTYLCPMNNKKMGIILVSFFIVLGIGFLGYYFKVMNEQKKISPLAIIGNDQNHHISPFAFINQEGKTITNDDIKDKIVVVEYFFATCKGICPKMNENLNIVYKKFKGNKNVLFLSHTVDPLKDTVEALKAYSQKFDADPLQWMFLTGDKKELYDMARYSYLISADDDTAGLSVDQDFIHDKHYILVDHLGRVRGFYDGLKDEDIDKIIGDIKTLIEEKKAI
jgi:protein SCO1/2